MSSVEYDMPKFGEEARVQTLAHVTRARVETRHVTGTSDAAYLIHAFGEDLLMKMQLNVRRFVVLYSIPVQKPIGSSTVAPHFERWATGASHAGWMIGWRDAAAPTEPDQHWVETYCYANLEPDFLVNDLHKLYWRTDILQMTRYFMLEAIRANVPLSPMRAGYRI
ncbi:hypothetical protein N825_02530 [Skermanella stibiiresistens SB22]|uniref:Uncharacterized protein n=1 Tax=Skermanella stibiiresistens SB22 TaxID=1385369 RepID=W9HDI1_9PROT|nr:hypothetical protein N825_02530 [Skermanella stibiiresistens SB22]